MAIVHKKAMVPDKAEDMAFEGIALYPAENKESGYYFLNLQTGTIVSRSSYVVSPSYSSTARMVLERLYQKDLKKAAKLPRLRGDNESLASLRLQPSESSRVVYDSEQPIAEYMINVDPIDELLDENYVMATTESAFEEVRNAEDRGEHFYNAVEETVEQMQKFETLSQYFMCILPEIESEVLMYAAQLSMK